MDIKAKDLRSRNMARIRSSNTQPELFIRSMLHAAGYRFRVNYREVAGSPDIYFTLKKVAIFVHGCYWHRHANCKFCYRPKTNVEFWDKKFSLNVARDADNKEKLRRAGIRVLVIWECTIKNSKSENHSKTLLARITEFINDSSCMYSEI